MRTGILHILCWGVVFALLSGCSQPDLEIQDSKIGVDFSLDANPATRASSDVGTPTHSVDRVLVLPFRKVNLGLPNTDNTNFVADWTNAQQYDIAHFPANSLKIWLDPQKTYKILAIGYNHTDYNHQSPAAASNRINLTVQPVPTTLANFQFYPKQPNQVPEFFINYLTAKSGNTTIGQVFIPANGIKLEGRLGRIISALGLKITNVPSSVTSIKLLADNMVKAVRLSDSTATVIQQVGDGESRAIGDLSISSGNATYGNFLLPTQNTYKMRLYVDVTQSGVTRRYQLTFNDQSGAASNNRVILLPNQAVKITGRFVDLDVGFTVTYGINLEDDIWDGITTTGSV